MTPARARVRAVRDFDELVATPFAGRVNALCWPRTLAGDFAEVAAALDATVASDANITPLDEARLAALPLGTSGRAAVALMLEDARRLQERGLAPELNFIRAYPKDGESRVSTDVYSFHADSAPIPADTWLCTYFGPASEGLDNDEARRHVDIPETRAALLAEFGGPDGPAFEEFLAESCYNLHYASAPNAQPYGFGVGPLWRIAVEFPGSPVPPCIHRAPITAPGELRLLLIS